MYACNAANRRSSNHKKMHEGYVDLIGTISLVGDDRQPCECSSVSSDSFCCNIVLSDIESTALDLKKFSHSSYISGLVVIWL